MPPKLTDEIIDAAIQGFEQQRAQIDQRIAELRGMRSGNHGSPAAVSGAAPPKKRKFSADARRRMREAQQRRWAGVRGTSETAPKSEAAAAKPAKHRRKMSAQGRKAIAEATRKRWEAFRAAKKAAVSKSAPAKKSGSSKATKATKKASVKKPAAPAAVTNTSAG